MWKIAGNFVDADYLVSEEIAIQKRKRYMEDCVESPTVVLFGAGGCFRDNCQKLKRDYGVEYVCDNDSRKWGKEFGGIKCIPPKELKEIKNLFVIITVYEVNVVNQIKGQLQELDIKNSEYLYGEHFIGLWNIV